MYSNPKLGYCVKLENTRSLSMAANFSFSLNIYRYMETDRMEI